MLALVEKVSSPNWIFEPYELVADVIPCLACVHLLFCNILPDLSSTKSKFGFSQAAAASCIPREKTGNAPTRKPIAKSFHVAKAAPFLLRRVRY